MLQTLWCCCIDVILLHIVVLSCQEHSSKIEKVDKSKNLHEFLYNVTISCLKQAREENIDKICIAERFFIQILEREGFSEQATSDLESLWYLVLDGDSLVHLLSHIKDKMEENKENSGRLHVFVENLALDCIKKIKSEETMGRGDLSCFLVEDEQKYVAASEIVMSVPEKFGHIALLNWTCQELSLHDEASSISEHVFSFLKFALDGLREDEQFSMNPLSSVVTGKLQNIFEKCVSSKLSTLFRRKYLDKLVNITTESRDDHPDVILLLLDVVSKMDSSPNVKATMQGLPVAKIAVLQEALLSNYLEFFDGILQMQTRHAYKYDQFVKTLDTACKTYVERTKEDDTKGFVEKVVNGLKARHSAKRKLCFMLDACFKNRGKV